MPDSEWDNEDFDPDAPEDDHEDKERDPKIDIAKDFLLSFFSQRPNDIFYLTQLEVLHEGAFFPWITRGALVELADEGRIKSEYLTLDAQKIHGIIRALDLGLIPEQNPAALELRFFRAKTTAREARYWKRKANRVAALVTAYSRSSLTHALGPHAEVMMDSALSSVGFVRRAKDVNEWNDKTWTQSGHNLDRVYERDGVAYGAEIKNTLGIIEHKELSLKTRLALHLGLRPMFIMRWAPKNYIEEVRNHGGFTLVYKWQLYPHGFGGVAQAIRDELELPVDAPRIIADNTVQRFLNWHELQLRVDIVRDYLERSFPNHTIKCESRRKVEYFRITRSKIRLIDMANFAPLPKDPGLRSEATTKTLEQRAQREPIRRVRAKQKFFRDLSLEELKQYLVENNLAECLLKKTDLELTLAGLKDPG